MYGIPEHRGAIDKCDAIDVIVSFKLERNVCK